MRLNFALPIFAALYPAMRGLADTKVTSKYTAEGQTTETTTYMQDERLRYEYGQDATLLRDCTQKLITQLNMKNRTFLSLPEEPKAAADLSNITVTDAGEHKEMFGHTARHVRMTQLIEDGHSRVETDGWYIDSKAMPSCATRAGPKGAANAGYPLRYTITTYKDGTQSAATVSMEVTELLDGPIEAALFELPAGYTDAAKPAAASATGSQPPSKAPGAVRIAAVAIQNKAKQAAVNPAAYEHMIAQLKEARLDVVPLAAGPAESVQAKAAEAQCDYVLYTEVASVDKPAAGKVGRLLRKAPVVGQVPGGDAYEARVDYRLVPVGSASPALASTAVGKTGSTFTFNWKTAVSIASVVAPPMMMARMMSMSGAFNPNMMNALVSGKGYGASMTGTDPMMSTMGMFLQGANMFSAVAPRSAANPNAGDTAIAAALDQEARAVVAQLKK
jgi:hypothetical protein